MKIRILAAALAFSLGIHGVARAAQLPSTRISADAKWLLHADLAGFRGSELGRYVQTNMLDETLQEISESMKFDAKALARKVTSITAYGTDFKKEPEQSMASGVLIIQADAEAQTIVEGALAAQMLAATNGPMKKLQTQPYPLYAVAKDLFGAIQPDGVIMLGKSRERIDHAAQVMAGKRPNLSSGKAFTDFPAAPDSFLLIGVAEGFNQFGEMPAQAKVLQMAEGARVVFGEKADRLFLELALKSKSQESVTQMQQVLQGIIALFSLGEPQDKDLSDLVKGTKVTATDKMVVVGMEFPESRAVARIAEENKEDSASHDKNAPPKQHKPKKKKNKHADEGGGTVEKESSEKPEPK